MKFAVVDTETTGGRPGPDRITEIGIVLMDGTDIVGEFHSLVNPQRPIPPFVQRLTGIDDAMVADAPLFADIAKEVASLLKDRIFVAHNVAFDHGFLRKELEMCGYPFNVPRLCTVRLTRSAFPGFASYSLSTIAPQLGVPDWGAHRALGDAQAAARLLQMAWEKIGETGIAAQAKGYAPPSILPPGWTPQRMADVPAIPGVLRVLGKTGNILYVTEAAHLREKATDLLSNPAKRGPLAKVKSQAHDLDFEPTGSLILAKLIAFQTLLVDKPPLNRQVRIPSDVGPDMRDQVIVEQGRSPGEKVAIVIRQGRLLGYAYFDEYESLNQEELEDRLEPLDVGGNLAPMLKHLRHTNH